MKSYFVDTNYILRLILKDDYAQANVVLTLFKSAVKGEVLLFTSLIVFFELNWVLTRHYERDKNECIRVFEDLLEMNKLHFEERHVFRLAVMIYKKNSISLEDCYNIVVYKKYSYDNFATFDKKLLNVLKNS